MSRNKDRPTEALPTHSGAGQIVAGMLAGLEHLIANRPPPVTEIQERYRDSWDTADGITVDGLGDEVERPEPPDRSGARL